MLVLELTEQPSFSSV